MQGIVEQRAYPAVCVLFAKGARGRRALFVSETQQLGAEADELIDAVR
jgi:hypothetical protein